MAGKSRVKDQAERVAAGKSKYKTQDELDWDNVKVSLTRHKGLLVQTANALGTTRQTLTRYLNNHPALKEHADAQKEGVKDRLEETAWDIALGKKDGIGQWTRKPDAKMVQFLLKTYVQDRGYYDGPQFGQGNSDQTIMINITGKFVEDDKKASDRSPIVEHDPILELEEAKEAAKTGNPAKLDAKP